MKAFRKFINLDESYFFSHFALQKEITKLYQATCQVADR